MPLIKVQTSVQKPEPTQVETLLKTLSSKLASHLGKPESYVMTAFEAEIPMTFGGTTDPVCYIEIKNIGKMSPSQTKNMSQDFCQVVQEELGVPANRTYLEFADADRHLWGWNGSTF
jgi:phenylpyruvate tautomerase